jgi:foldase protein PrsA
MVLLSGLLLATSVAAAPPKPSAVLVTVDGVPLKRAELMDRAWKQYGTVVLNEAVDEVIVHQAAKDMGVQADGGEVEARIKRIQGQFADETTFSARLAANGSSLAELRAQITEQVLREDMVTKAKGLRVTDEELKAFFDANKEKLAAPESYHLRHIVVAGEKEANDFLTAIKAGADFAKLASQVSLDDATKDRSGDMGFISRGMLLPELEKAAFALKPGEVGGPVKTQLGYHLLKVEEVRPAKPAVFDAIKDDLRKSLLADKINKAWPEYLKELRAKAKIERPKGQ